MTTVGHRGNSAGIEGIVLNNSRIIAAIVLTALLAVAAVYLSGYLSLLLLGLDPGLLSFGTYY